MLNYFNGCGVVGNEEISNRSTWRNSKSRYIVRMRNDSFKYEISETYPFREFASLDREAHHHGLQLLF